MTVESTFFMIKPEAFEKKLVGDIISVIEKNGFTMVRGKIMQASRALVEKHYYKDDAWKKEKGGYILSDYAKMGMDPVKEIGTNDPLETGRILLERVITHMTSGPVFIMELSGEDAAARLLKLCGPTEPAKASPDTIRGMFSKDRNMDAVVEKRPLLNLVHRSDDVPNAVAEMKLWFGDNQNSD